MLPTESGRLDAGDPPQSLTAQPRRIAARFSEVRLWRCRRGPVHWELVGDQQIRMAAQSAAKPYLGKRPKPSFHYGSWGGPGGFRGATTNCAGQGGGDVPGGK